MSRSSLAGIVNGSMFDNQNAIPGKDRNFYEHTTVLSVSTMETSNSKLSWYSQDLQCTVLLLRSAIQTVQPSFQ